MASIAAVLSAASLALILATPRPGWAQPAPASEPADTAAPAEQPGGLLPWPGEWLTDALVGTLVDVGGRFVEALRRDVDWALGADGQGPDFVSRTPPAYSYQSPSVRQLADATRAAANAALAVLTMWAGYQLMAGPRGRSVNSVHSVLELAPRLALAALLANTSLWWGALAIDGANALGSMAAPITLPGREATADTGETLALVAAGLVYWLVALLLVLQQLMRLALVDVLLVLSPLGLLLWAMPQTQAWGRLWSDLFLATVFAQPVQMLVLKLGTLLVGELGGGGPLVSLLLGIGVAYLVLKVPGMLRSGLVRGGGGQAGVLAAVLAAQQLGRAVGVRR